MIPPMLPTVLAIDRSTTNHPQIEGLISLMDLPFEQGSAGAAFLCIAQLGQLTGLELHLLDGTPTWLVSWRWLSVTRSGALVPLHVGFYSGLLRLPHSMEADFEE